MISFSLDRLVGAQIADIEPGEFFIWEEVLAVLLTPPTSGGMEARLMTLSGDNAFQLNLLDVHYRDQVLPLKLDPAGIRLNVDFTSATSLLENHRRGRLIFSRGGGACISAVHTNPRDRMFTPAAVLKDWTVCNMSEPKFGFDRWALTYQSEAGESGDLVVYDRMPEAQQ